MTIDKAVELNDALSKDMEAKGMHQCAAAIRLSNEALKAVAGFRKKQLTRPFHQLPGETK